MPVEFGQLEINGEYDRNDLAKLWGYEGREAISRGIVTPSGDDKIVLFVTQENQAANQYRNYLEGDQLFMDGEVGHANDNRLVSANRKGDEIHLFYRELPRNPFMYFGQVWLSSYELLSPMASRFIFNTSQLGAIAESSKLTEEMTHGQGKEFIADPEGKERYALHVTYERSVKNRTEALRIHGTVCKCCGFDFNLVYGPELAREYIEVHHDTSITESVSQMKPATDLVPLCSNCHSMVHRKKGEIIPVDQLRKLLKDNGWKLPLVARMQSDS